MLAVINVWLDIVSALLAAGVILGFVIPHFLGSVATGRVRKHFIDDYWDPVAHRAHDPKTYGYGHPYADDFPLYSRAWHWVNIVSFVFLAVSGIYIRYPFFDGGREIMRFIHYFFMYIITINLMVRLYMLRKDWRNYLIFDLDDLRMAPAILKYYAFIGPPYEHKKKYNPIQRPTYPLLWLLIGAQALTGFIIFRPTIVPGFLSEIIGGTASLAAWMRLFHSANMRIMLLIATIHSYLGIMEDYPVLKYFWFAKEPDWDKYRHDDHHGDDHGDDHGEAGPTDEQDESAPEMAH